MHNERLVGSRIEPSLQGFQRSAGMTAHQNHGGSMPSVYTSSNISQTVDHPKTTGEKYQSMSVQSVPAAVGMVSKNSFPVTTSDNQKIYTQKSHHQVMQQPVYRTQANSSIVQHHQQVISGWQYSGRDPTQPNVFVGPTNVRHIPSNVHLSQHPNLYHHPPQRMRQDQYVASQPFLQVKPAAGLNGPHEEVSPSDLQPNKFSQFSDHESHLSSTSQVNLRRSIESLNSYQMANPNIADRNSGHFGQASIMSNNICYSN